MSGQIFISYRQVDSWAVADALCQRLRAQFGAKQIFMDLDSIELGENFVKVIKTTVAKCDVLLAVIGKKWLNTKDEIGARRLDNPVDWVRTEIGTALGRQMRVIPILVDRAKMPRATDLPEDLKSLASLNALRITRDSFVGDCRRLVHAIQLVLEKRAAAPTSPSAPLPTLTASPASALMATWDPEFSKTRGLEHRKQGEYDNAISAYTDAIWLNPKDADAYRSRGLTYRLKEEYDKAISDYTQAIRLNPKDADAYNFRANVYYEKREYDKVISDNTEAIRLDPNYAPAYYSRAGAYHGRKEYDKAISDYSEAIRLDPNYAAAYTSRGDAYYEKKEYDKAISDYNEAIRSDPDYAWGHVGRGDAYYRKKEYDKAISDYTEAIWLNLNALNLNYAYYKRGNAYCAKNEYNKAISDYTDAIRLDPKDAYAYNRRGLAYRELGKRLEAMVDFNQAKKLGYTELQ